MVSYTCVRDVMDQILGFTIIIILVFGIIQFPNSTTIASNSTNIFPPESKPYGLSYPEHLQNYWKWIISIPLDQSPMEDTGENCSINQTNTNSSVFYLANSGGGVVTRTCNVPADKALFIPIYPMVLAKAESPDATDEDLRNDAKADVDRVLKSSLSLKIDNSVYKNLTAYRIISDIFDIYFPENAIFGTASPGIYKSAADGYYIITPPLSKGNHTIEFGSAQSGNQPYSQHVTYHLTVE